MFYYIINIFLLI